jgi:hypothetical protein
LSKPLFSDLTLKTQVASLPIFSDESLVDPSLLNLTNFNNFSNEVIVDSLEESYENLKYINYLFYLNYKNVIQLKTSHINPLSYTHVLDNFRPDYEDNSWYTNIYTKTQEGYQTSKTLNESDLRVTNSMKLRSSTRSAIVTYNAIQKVFKSRFDEGRSNARLQDFSNSYVSHPFLTEKKSPYESILGKNTDSFFNVNSYKQSLNKSFSLNSSI